MTSPACRFGCDDAPVAVVAFDKGCACYPDDREQALCLHHLMQSEPIGGSSVIRWLTTDGKPPVWAEP